MTGRNSDDVQCTSSPGQRRTGRTLSHVTTMNTHGHFDTCVNLMTTNNVSVIPHSRVVSCARLEGEVGGTSYSGVTSDVERCMWKLSRTSNQYH